MRLINDQKSDSKKTTAARRGGQRETCTCTYTENDGTLTTCHARGEENAGPRWCARLMHVAFLSTSDGLLHDEVHCILWVSVHPHSSPARIQPTRGVRPSVSPSSVNH